MCSCEARLGELEELVTTGKMTIASLIRRVELLEGTLHDVLVATSKGRQQVRHEDQQESVGQKQQSEELVDLDGSQEQEKLEDMEKDQQQGLK